MEEIWEDIAGYKGLYQISNYGRVKSFIRQSPQILHYIFSSKGYYKVRLTKNGTEKRFYVHLLVWDTFGDRPRNNTKIVVDHIDENKLNNCISNLQLLSNRANIIKSRIKDRVLPEGVSYDKRAQKFRARIWDGKKDKHIGYFNCPTLASQAYIKAKANYGF